MYPQHQTPCVNDLHYAEITAELSADRRWERNFFPAVICILNNATSIVTFTRAWIGYDN